MRFNIITMGCKVNQYESQAISESLQKLGYIQEKNPALASTVIVNSCAVTARAVRDLKKTCRQVGRDCPEARLIITGCAAQVFEQELTMLDEVHLVVPQKNKRRLLQGLEQLGFQNDQADDYLISDYYRARAVVKVQDGCTHNCSFCIVPETRGNSVSRPFQIILNEISRLLIKGITEISLCGINLRLYGQDLPHKPDFWDLISYLEENLQPDWGHKARFRISSLDPSQLNQKALEVLESSRMICPHLHISVQSGSPIILEKMNRSHYSPETILEFSDNLSRVWHLFSMGADILVGFPDESPADHDLTRRLISRLPLSYAHIFPFSPRPATPAARFSNQINQETKKNRAWDLNQIIRAKRKAFMNRLLEQKSLDIVMEDNFKGMSEYYMECRVNNLAPGLSPRQRIKALPLEIRDDFLLVKQI
ncbi:MiaB/RimO family radical SAM methylthiotransferase [Desulfonatronovibrio hydrogenovorans]|uniref:MiaB/RimO family radical SAM methylthiotransferase n=1 Tax=Desulfonatronovibrio hydrogenovorans TaxID=53245 RepID=UPI00049197C9|nr:MiaB/RimO family radical SAM methylthiotransferase [Desulfonatronovibrio hydrogenovorans]